MRKKAALVLVWALMPLITSCSIRSVTIGDIVTGPTVTEEINVPVPGDGSVAEVQIGMGGGELAMDVGDVGALVRGTVAYNVEELKPSVDVRGAQIRIEQGDIEGKRIPLGDWSDVQNRWDLTLGTAPMTLTVSAGAAKATLSGLANLDAAEIHFNGGAGEFTLDFAGDLGQDMLVTVDAGAAQVNIVVPEGTTAELSFQGALTDISAYDNWKESGGRYLLVGEGPRIRFEIRMGVGSLDLRNY